MTEQDVIRTRRDLVEFLAADLAAHGFTRWNLETRLRSPELGYQRLMRRTEYYASRRDPLGRLLFIVARVRLARRSVITGISVPPGVFGRGLSIAHVGSVVVNDQVHAGRYCRIHSATNLGVHEGHAPTLGDFVYIGPGAVIYGGVTLGDRCTVGANSVVGESVPAGVTVAGSPARPVSDRGSESVMPEPIVAVMRREGLLG